MFVVLGVRGGGNKNSINIIMLPILHLWMKLYYVKEVLQC